MTVFINIDACECKLTTSVLVLILLATETFPCLYKKATVSLIAPQQICCNSYGYIQYEQPIATCA